MCIVSSYCSVVLIEPLHSLPCSVRPHLDCSLSSSSRLVDMRIIHLKRRFFEIQKVQMVSSYPSHSSSESNKFISMELNHSRTWIEFETEGAVQTHPLTYSSAETIALLQ